MRFGLRTIVVATALVIVVTALAAPVASAAGPGAVGASGMMGGGTVTSGGWCGGGIWSGSGSWGGTGMWGAGSGATWLTGHPEALQAWLRLRADHITTMQAWYDTYKADPTSAEAQQALNDIWTAFWNDMKAFYEQYGNGAAWTCPSAGMWSGWDMGGMMGQHDWDAAHMWGTGYGAAWMTRHRDGFGQWLTMRARQTTAVGAWARTYRGALTTTAAQNALHTLRARHRAEVKAFYTHHGLTVTTDRMRNGAGGWMGLGGMWGGFGW
jgi:hypothetical protein